MNRREILRYAALATGAAVSAPFASAFLTGCKRDVEVVAGKIAYEPRFFNADEYEFITKFADTIIPRTDTPGASDVGVPEIIDKIVADVYKEEDQVLLKENLGKMMAKMDADNAAHGKFVLANDETLLMYLQDQDAQYKNEETDWIAAGEEAEAMRETYFGLKQAVIANYFGSEEVATTQLAYLPVPGEYIPCGDLEELTGGVAWAI